MIDLHIVVLSADGAERTYKRAASLLPDNPMPIERTIQSFFICGSDVNAVMRPLALQRYFICIPPCGEYAVLCFLAAGTPHRNQIERNNLLAFAAFCFDEPRSSFIDGKQLVSAEGTGHHMGTHGRCSTDGFAKFLHQLRRTFIHRRRSFMTNKLLTKI